MAAHPSEQATDVLIDAEWFGDAAPDPRRARAGPQELEGRTRSGVIRGTLRSRAEVARVLTAQTVV